MSTTRNSDIRGINTAKVTTSKRRQNAQTVNNPKNPKEKYKATPPVIHITIQTVLDKICADKKKSKSKFVPDTRVPCVKDVYRSVKDIRDKAKKRPDRREKTRLMFPEMRGGVLYSRCWCLHRDGLQDHCPLSQCQGRPECLVKPWAVCPPAKFVRLRHPELYPTASDSSCTQ